MVPEVCVGDREQENEQPEGIIGEFHMWETGSDQGDTVISVLIPSSESMNYEILVEILNYGW